MMKKVLFDLECSQPNASGKFHGGGEYTKTVFEHLVTHYAQICEIAAFYNPEKFCEQWVLDLIEEYKVHLIEVYTFNDIQNVLKNNEYDIFYCGLPSKYTMMKLPNQALRICTVHGLRTLEFRDDKYSFLFMKSFAGKIKWLIKFFFPSVRIKRAKRGYLRNTYIFDKIICVSKHTYYSLKNNMPQIANKVCGICYTPYKHVAVPSWEIVDLPSKFILMVSGNRAEKNIARAIKALDEMYTSQLLNCETVITGNVPVTIRRMIKNKQRFIFMDYVSIEKLETLYSECSVFLYPSLNEGFGMPPEEAMKYGKTCIVSAVCSLPEIYENAVYYVNPYDIGEIKNRITWALQEPIDKQTIQEKIELLQQKQERHLDFLCKMIAGIS